jgi:tetratricopeptide (TPR) repeat protein
MAQKMIRLLIFAVTLLATLPGYGQICDLHTGAPMQMKVQLTFGDQAPDAAPGGVVNQNDPLHRGDSAGNQRRYDFIAMQIHVQLQDPTGGTFQEQTPDSDGQLRLTVCKKSIYRLRVIGPQIEEAIMDSVQPGSGDSLVTVVLQRKLTKEQRKAQEATISAHSLNIPRKAQRQLEKGDDALKNRELAKAEKYYRRAIAIDPDFEEAQNRLGVVFMQQGQKSEGKAAFDRAVAINHNYAPAEINLAKIAFDEKRYDNSYALASQALRSEPLNPDGLFVAAEASFFKGAYPETVSYTRTLHSLPHKQYALAHFLAAKSLEAQNQPQEALVEYQTFIEEDPADPNARRARDLILLLQASLARGDAQPSPH